MRLTGAASVSTGRVTRRRRRRGPAAFEQHVLVRRRFVGRVRARGTSGVARLTPSGARGRNGPVMSGASSRILPASETAARRGTAGRSSTSAGEGKNKGRSSTGFSSRAPMMPIEIERRPRFVGPEIQGQVQGIGFADGQRKFVTAVPAAVAALKPQISTLGTFHGVLVGQAPPGDV